MNEDDPLQNNNHLENTAEDFEVEIKPIKVLHPKKKKPEIILKKKE